MIVDPMPGPGTFILIWLLAIAGAYWGLRAKQPSMAPFAYAVCVLVHALVGREGVWIVEHLAHWRADGAWSILLVAPLTFVVSHGIQRFSWAVFLEQLQGLLRGEQHKRGALVVEAQARPVVELKQAAAAGAITLAGFPVGLEDEPKHFKIMGTTGAGKSTVIRELVHGALARGDRVVIADPGGDYLSRFYAPEHGDVVLNPFDARSRKWNPLAEIDAPYEVDPLARSLIPGTDEWFGYARTFLAAVLAQCRQAGLSEVHELWYLVAIADTAELRELLQGTPARPFLDESNGRMFSSIRSVAVSALAPLQYIQGQPGDESFSVRRWIREGRGALYLPYQAEEIDSLRTLIACWMRLAIFQTMGLGELPREQQEKQENRKIWFVVDELDAVGRIDGLKDALARVRKSGGRCVIGFQSIAQVSETYGQGEAHTIVENCGNTLILRCSASEAGGTAQFASQLIGEREIIRTIRSATTSWGPSHSSSTSRTPDHRVEQAVLASQIETLADLEGYLRFASTNFWARIPIDPKDLPIIAPVRVSVADKTRATGGRGAGPSLY